MTNTNRGLWLAAAASFTLGFAMSCGGTDTPDAGTGACTTDATCGSGKGCHPVLKTCVATCTGATDCPSNEKTCAKINNSASSFCTCSTDQLCAASNAGQICNAVTSQCSARCTATSCGSGSTCDMTTGQCSGGNTDAGTDAGVTDAGVACTSANDEPDVCGYGNVCYTDMRCDSAVNDTACTNIAMSTHTPWNAATSTGPIIYNVTDDTDVAAGCTGATDVPFTLTVYAYAGTTDFTANINQAVQLTYYTSTGAARPVNGVLVGTQMNAWSGYTVSNMGRNVAIKMTLCAPMGTTALTAGFGFSGGNAYCADLTRN
jgi:hypothetical protein